MIGQPNSDAKVLNKDIIINQKTRRKSSKDFQDAEKKASRWSKKSSSETY